jgi:hypothetical protein
MTDPRFWVALAAVVGVVAAFYPGFWVLEVQILSEPLGLPFLGLLTLALADLWHRPSLGRAALTGRSPERLRSSDPNSSP